MDKKKLEKECKKEIKKKVKLIRKKQSKKRVIPLKKIISLGIMSIVFALIFVEINYLFLTKGKEEYNSEIHTCENIKELTFRTDLDADFVKWYYDKEDGKKDGKLNCFDLQGNYSKGGLTTCKVCTSWHRKTYCEENPNDEKKCTCLEYLKIYCIPDDCPDYAGYCDTKDGALSYISYKNRDNPDCVLEYSRDSWICIQARGKTDFEKFKEENPDCLYYGHTNKGDFVCVN